MKVLFCPAPHTMELQEHPEPELSGPQNVIVRIKRVGICGSDGGRFHWTNALMKKPHIGGHEYSGVVEQIGAEVAAQFPNLKVGTRVAGMPIDHCSVCEFCTAGLPQHCAKRRVMGAHPTWPGAFAELVETPAKLLVPIPESMSFEAAATNEPAACSTWAGDRCETFLPRGLKGTTGFIAGAGPIGLLALQDVLARGASRVVVTDTDDSRLQSVEACGGIGLNAMTPDLVAAAQKLMGGLGDFSIDCVGMGRTRDQCGFLTKPYQPSAWVGLHEDTESTVSAGQYVRRGVISIGVFAFTPNAFKLATERLNSGKMGFRDSDVVVCGLAQGQKWFTRLFDDNKPGKPQKVIFDPTL